MNQWTIVCDFDGTVSVGDVTDLLLERYGAPGWEELETAWQLGEIGSRACLAGQIALLDASPAQLDAAVASIAIDPAFPAFVDDARAAGVSLTVVSDGLDRAIHALLARYGLGDLPIVANHLEQSGARSWRLEFPHSNPGCRAASGTCKCERAEGLRRLAPNVLLIGDGSSDFCVAGSADFVFAKHRLIAHCREQGYAHLPMHGFAEARAALPRLLAGELHAHPHRSHQDI
jgi:2,3-diketo-5-methylthio-1-phosphopentane phosphatase